MNKPTTEQLLGEISPNPLADLRNALQAHDKRQNGLEPGDEVLAGLATAARAVLASSEPQPVVLTFEEAPTESDLEEMRAAMRGHGLRGVMVLRSHIQELRLDRPARVGQAVFKAGVSWSIVIDAAQRLYAGDQPAASGNLAALDQALQLIQPALQPAGAADPWIPADNVPEREDFIVYSPELRNPVDMLIGRLIDGRWHCGGYEMVNVTHVAPRPAPPVFYEREASGCGACGDACQGREGGCRVQEESPPTGLHDGGAA